MNLEGVMLPASGIGDHIVDDHEPKIEDVEQEVSLILHADAVVDPGTVMVHHVDTLVAD